MEEQVWSVFRREDVEKYLKEILHAVAKIVYNEMYPYVWLICFYHVFLIFITLANFMLLYKATYQATSSSLFFSVKGGGGVNL